MPAQGLPPGVMGFSYELSDDGKLALVYVVAAKRAALESMGQAVSEAARLGQAGELADKVRVFHPHQQSRPEVEQALRLLKKDFRLEHFTGVRP